ncbi:hypothetical protein JTE90_018054 [Oedothorax gibbosus]|uniref:Uncharacterized protein n=1 Tax=Oedothorax gibbosus TaxID=931172 RepID=A0AAV6TDF9_9ARAC|nr:hypothetical protein JTE90_018054 [Oedothorax gibbosus]
MVGPHPTIDSFDKADLKDNVAGTSSPLHPCDQPKEKPFPPSRDPHPSKAPVFDIAPRNIAIKYNTKRRTLSRQTGSRLPRPALLLRGRGNNKGKKNVTTSE